MSTVLVAMRSAKTGVKQRRSATGFTLLEILLVITLATLMLTLVPANFSAVVPGVERQAQVRHFIAALRAARGTAIREQREVILVLDIRQQQYSLQGAEGVTKLPVGLRFQYLPVLAPAVTEPLALIRFFSDGSSSGGVVEMRAAEQAYRITIDWLTGRIAYAETT